MPLPLYRRPFNSDSICMRTLFLIISIFCSLTLAAQQYITVQGSIKGAESRQISLFLMHNYLTDSLQPIDQQKADESDRFYFRFPLKQVRECALECGFQRAFFFVEPGKNYELTIIDFDYNDQHNYFLDPQFLQFNLSESGGVDTLNDAAGRFSFHCAQYIDAYLPEIYRQRLGNYLDTLMLLADTLNAYGKDFLQNFYPYHAAAYTNDSRTHSRQRIFKEYIDGRDVLYNNPAYMDFFCGFFEKRLISGSGPLDAYVLEPAINQSRDFRALMDTLGRDTLLRNEKIRELAFLCNFNDLYNFPRFRKDALIEILQQMSVQSDFKEHREAAASFIYNHRRFGIGADAPSLKGVDCQGNIFDADSLSHKYVIVSFVKLWCQKCLSDIKLIDKMIAPYRDEMELLVVSLDDDPDARAWLCRNYGSLATIVYVGADAAFVRDWQVKSFPMNVILDAEGRYLRYPASQPLEGLELELAPIFRQIQKERSARKKKRLFVPEGLQKY